MFNITKVIRRFKWSASEIITDRKSRFQGRHIELQNVEDIPKILQDLLKEHKSIARASHPHIIAWAVEKDNQIIHGFKDNGEKGAGMRLTEMLSKHKLKNILVIVTRWYGGNPIGSSRYRHIINCSLDSLRKSKKI
ncbi:hypothetical protein G210_4396 [Candida maltosa Xu316]|uniref:Impact N-terminal domain-containing protein n=1 Tax=Candida maltosa (strain Xu316) TaxID=1245528 RepID=M3HDW2_CANMX|nr:hypothetical protein G210_4396 [Candida maltosa Xu316]